MSDDIRKIVRLETAIKSLLDSDDTLEALRELVSPFAERRGWVYGCQSGEESWEWYVECIFNEARLYAALGKDDARSVLGVWRRFRAVCELLALGAREE